MGVGADAEVQAAGESGTEEAGAPSATPATLFGSFPGDGGGVGDEGSGAAAAAAPVCFCKHAHGWHALISPWRERRWPPPRLRRRHALPAKVEGAAEEEKGGAGGLSRQRPQSWELLPPAAIRRP